MALALDSLNSRVAQLAVAKGGEIPLFATDKPLIKMMKRDGKDAVGRSILRELVLGATGQGTNLTGDGFDVAPAGVQRTLNGYKMAFWGALVPVNVAQKALDELTDDAHSADEVIGTYLGANVEIFWEDVEYWILTGAVRDSSNGIFRTAGMFADLQTLNGAITWTNSEANTTDRGLLELAGEASQSGSVQGLAKGNGNVNRYGAGTGWATGTTASALSAAYRRASSFAGVPVDLGFADSDSWGRLEAYLRNNVQVGTINDKGQLSSENFLVFRNAKVFSCENLDTANASYSGTTASSSSSITGGVIYFMPSKRMESLIRLQSTPKFADISTNQAVVTAKLLPRLQFLTGRLGSMAAVAGTRIP